MKKLFLVAMLMLMGSALFAQNVIYTIPTRATKFGKPIKIGDFIYITADLTLYQSKKPFSRDVTGTTFLASGANYAVANTTWVSGAVAATTGTFSSTLGVTGATTLAGALNAAGACGFGASNNKVTIAAATGNTAIAGTLNVTGSSVMAALGATTGTFSGKTTALTYRALDSLLVGPHKLYRGTTATALWCNDTIHSLLGFKTGAAGEVSTGTLTVTGNSTQTGTSLHTGVATFTAAPVMSNGATFTNSDTTVTAVVGKVVLKGTTLYLCVSTTGRKWYAITATAN